MVVLEYDVIELSSTIRRERAEPLGSKQKFWFRHDDGKLWLFKYARENTGEHWAEKAAAEIAGALGVPHAAVELAIVDGRWGAICRDFTDDGKVPLVHGNELLVEQNPKYPVERRYGVRTHTVDAIRDVLVQEFIMAPALSKVAVMGSSFDVFLGYLMLDALIGNTDRHHENWGILLQSDQPRRGLLAPSFDHASSLGRELTTEVRRRKFQKSGGVYDVEKYSARARSALFESPRALRPMSPVVAFRKAAEGSPIAARWWLERLRSQLKSLAQVMAAVPAAAIGDEARSFAEQLLSANAESLLS